MTRGPRRGAGAIFAVPAIIGAGTLTGLIAGLFGDGGWDIAAWTGLTIPAAIGVLAWRGRSFRRW